MANIDRTRMLMLVEQPSRAALQRFLATWQPMQLETRKESEFRSLLRWALDVDPMVI